MIFQSIFLTPADHALPTNFGYTFYSMYKTLLQTPQYCINFHDFSDPTTAAQPRAVNSMLTRSRFRPHVGCSGLTANMSFWRPVDHDARAPGTRSPATRTATATASHSTTTNTPL